MANTKAVNDNPRDKKHKLTITFVQETDGVADGRTLVEEFSEDSTIHVIKCKVFAAELNKAVAAATDQLTDMALAELTKS
jgi:hypothetical protein